MLQINPAKRITIHELRCHPWVTGNSLKSVSFIHRTEVRIFLCRDWFYKCFKYFM